MSAASPEAPNDCVAVAATANNAQNIRLNIIETSHRISFAAVSEGATSSRQYFPFNLWKHYLWFALKLELRQKKLAAFSLTVVVVVQR
jgi:hypothetical protein